MIFKREEDGMGSDRNVFQLKRSRGIGDGFQLAILQPDRDSCMIQTSYDGGNPQQASAGLFHGETFFEPSCYRSNNVLVAQVSIQITFMKSFYRIGSGFDIGKKKTALGVDHGCLACLDQKD